MHVGFAKTFPDIPCVSQMYGGPSLRRGDTKEGLNNPSGIGCGGKGHWSTGNVGISTAN